MDDNKKAILKNAVINGANILLPTSVKLGLLAGETIYKLYGKDIKALFNIIDKDEKDTQAFFDIIDKEGFDFASTDAVCVKLNRALTEEEFNQFFQNEKAFETLYSECDIEFDKITPNPRTMDEMDIQFPEEVTSKEAVEFSLLLNKYIKDLGKKLRIESVSAYLTESYLQSIIDEVVEEN